MLVLAPLLHVHLVHAAALQDLVVVALEFGVVDQVYALVHADLAHGDLYEFALLQPALQILVGLHELVGHVLYRARLALSVH